MHKYLTSCIFIVLAMIVIYTNVQSFFQSEINICLCDMLHIKLFAIKFEHCELMLVSYECWFSARVGAKVLAYRMQKAGRLHFPKLWHNLWKDLLIRGEFNNTKMESPNK